MTQYSLAQLTFVEASPPELIRLAGSTGYDYVGLRLLEVTGGDAWPLASDAKLLRETKEALAAFGVGLLDIELVRLQPETIIADLEPTIAVAAELGARHVLTQAHDSDWARLVHNFGSLCDLLAKYELTADIEFLTWTANRGVTETMQLLQSANRANVGIAVDTLHFHRSDCGFEDLRAVPPEWLHFIQISDGPQVGPDSVEGLIFAARQDRLNPGEGQLDLAGIIRELPSDIIVAIEIPNSAAAVRITNEERARRALDATKVVVAELGGGT